jgi:hypothetical protein
MYHKWHKKVLKAKRRNHFECGFVPQYKYVCRSAGLILWTVADMIVGFFKLESHSDPVNYSGKM